MQNDTTIYFQVVGSQTSAEFLLLRGLVVKRMVETSWHFINALSLVLDVMKFLNESGDRKLNTKPYGVKSFHLPFFSL